MFKKRSGITLIALIITIIVLLIIAGTTISLIIGDNGILQKSQSAKLNEQFLADGSDYFRLRSPCYNSSSYFVVVTTEGSIGSNGASSSYTCVNPCFCL